MPGTGRSVAKPPPDRACPQLGVRLAPFDGVLHGGLDVGLAGVARDAAVAVLGAPEGQRRAGRLGQGLGLLVAAVLHEAGLAAGLPAPDRVAVGLVDDRVELLGHVSPPSRVPFASMSGWRTMVT